MDKKGVAYEEVVLDGKDKELNELRQRTGMRTVPQIFINEKLIGGFSDMTQLDQEGQLDPLLEA